MHEKKVRVERDDYFCFGEIIDDDFAIDRIGTDRVPSIAQAIGLLRASTATIDGEAVICDEQGISDFDALLGRSYTATRSVPFLMP